MNTKESIRARRWGFAAAAVVSGAVAAINGLRLAEHDVPLPLTLASALSIFAVMAEVLTSWVIGMTSTTHRCRVTGCDFQVRLTNTDPDESIQWAEITASHPHHYFH